MLHRKGLHITIRQWYPEPLRSEPDLVSLFQELHATSTGSETKVHQREPGIKHAQEVTAHVGQGLPMYPFIFPPQYATGSPYILDRFSGTTQAVPWAPLSPLTPMTPGYRMIRSIYHSPPSPALTSQHSSSPSRTAPGYMGSDGRRQNATRVMRANQSAGSHHNHVDTARIREGIDVRTTV